MVFFLTGSEPDDNDNLMVITMMMAVTLKFMKSMKQINTLLLEKKGSTKIGAKWQEIQKI